MTTLLIKALVLTTFAFTLAGEAFGSCASNKNCLNGACCSVFVPCDKIACLRCWKDHGFCLGANVNSGEHREQCTSAGLFVNPKKYIAKITWREDSRDLDDCPTCRLFRKTEG